MANWKKVENYDYTEKLDGPGWAWEFLRRDKNFLEDYFSFLDGALLDEFGNPPVSFKETKLKNMQGTYFIDPPLAEKLSPKEIVKILLSDSKERKPISPEQYLARKWGLLRKIPNPDLNAQEVDIEIEFQESYPFPKILKSVEDLNKVPLAELVDYWSEQPEDDPLYIRKDRVVLEFTLTEKITPQIDRVKDFLLQAYNEYISNPLPQELPLANKGFTHKNNLKLRLRVLDSEINDPDMATEEKLNELYPEEEMVNAPLNYARLKKDIQKKSNKNGYLELSRIETQI